MNTDLKRHPRQIKPRRTLPVLLTPILLLALLYSPLSAQLQVGVSGYSVVDDNVFSSYKAEQDLYLLPSLNLSLSQPMSDWYYSADILQLMKNSQYNSFTHAIGTEIYPESTQSRLKTTLGASLSFRINQDDYSYRNFAQFRAYAAGKIYPRPNMLTKAEISYTNKSFPDVYSWNLPWDHQEFSIGAQNSLFLQTGTTLRGGLITYIRDFAPYQAFMDGYLYAGEIPTLWQALATLRLAQSFSGSMGGYTEFSYRYNPSESNPYEPEIMSFSPIDDYFGYEESAWTLNLKYKFSRRFSFSSSAYLYEKLYRNRPVYEYDFDTGEFLLDEEGYYISRGFTREDSGYSLNARLAWTLPKLLGKDRSAMLQLNYDLGSNNSNDPYFDYLKQTVSLYLAVNFHQ